MQSFGTRERRAAAAKNVTFISSCWCKDALCNLHDETRTCFASLACDSRTSFTFSSAIALSLRLFSSCIYSALQKNESCKFLEIGSSKMIQSYLDVRQSSVYFFFPKHALTLLGFLQQTQIGSMCCMQFLRHSHNSYTSLTYRLPPNRPFPPP
jgi:hypothetical protein